MVKHFLKIFLRTSVRNAGYTFINVGGLAIGLACSILILLWIRDETNYDRQHVLRDRIYQVKSFFFYPGQGNIVADATSGALVTGLRELPEIERACRISPFSRRVLIQSEEKSFYEEGLWADTTVFSMFTIPFAEGIAFRDDHSIVISQRLADKYFPNESALGKVVRINAEREATVTGVFENIPSASTWKFDFIMSYENYAKNDQYNSEWGAWSGGFTYVLLHEGTNIASLNEKIQNNITKPRIWPRWDNYCSLFLFPFKDSRLRNNFDQEGHQAGGRITYLQIFGAVGLFILLVAVINFMNLATARSVSRSKEIGVKKVSGAAKLGLLRQFFLESLLLASIALLISLVIAQLVLPEFNTLTQKDLNISFADPIVIGAILVITVFTGLLAGSYPAFLLSSLKPVVVLKGKFAGVGGKNLRKGLVVFQFSLSTVLIVCALMAHQQVKYLKEKDLGFDKNDIVYFPAKGRIERNLDGFKKSALENPGVVSIAESNSNPMQIFGSMVLSDDAWPGKTKDDNIIFTWTQADEDYLSLFDLQLVKGRNFSRANAADSLNFIINEEAARKMRLTDPIGAKLKAPHWGTIIGVVKNFHTNTLAFEIQPMIIAMTPKNRPLVFVKYQHGQAQQALTSLQALYRSFEPDLPMEYKFIDAPFGELYENELLIEKLSMYFTIIAIFISCLGLFGLASFTAESRTKEIGVRKVLGASVPQIITLLGKDFLLLMSLALATGLPLGYWGVVRFLDNYRYHTEIGAWLFIGITMLMVGITLISVGYQSAKAAMMNPVKTLRSE